MRSSRREELQSQEIGAIIIMIIILGILADMAFYAIFIYQPPPPPPHLVGELKYLSDKSNSTDPSTGVWLEIILDNPKKASLEKGWIIIYDYNHSSSYTKFSFDETLNNNPAERNGYFFEFYDNDTNKDISSHDMMLLYDHELREASFFLGITGYSGTIRINIEK